MEPHTLEDVNKRIEILPLRFAFKSDLLPLIDKIAFLDSYLGLVSVYLKQLTDYQANFRRLDW